MCQFKTYNKYESTFISIFSLLNVLILMSVLNTFTGASACIQLKKFDEANIWCEKGLAVSFTAIGILQEPMIYLLFPSLNIPSTLKTYFVKVQVYMDQFKFLENCPPTPPLSQT